jgi:hypothetical protein
VTGRRGFARRGSCLVQFGDPETADELVARARATDGTFARAEAALRADSRRRPCRYSVCRTAEVLVRADQPAGPSAPAMAMTMASPARASSSRSVPPRTCTKLLGSTVPTVPLGIRPALGELASSPST